MGHLARGRHRGPIASNSAKPELEFLIDDTRASTVLFDAAYAPLLQPFAGARGLDKQVRALSYEQLSAPNLPAAHRQNCQPSPARGAP